MSEGVTTRVVEAIAEVEGNDPADVDFVLEEYIDTDALDSLLEHSSTSCTLSFRVTDHEVIVSSEGQVEVDGSQHELIA